MIKEKLELDKQLLARQLAWLQISYDECKHKGELLSGVVANSVEEVRRRAQKAEDRIKDGEYLTEEEYRLERDSFLKTL